MGRAKLTGSLLRLGSLVRSSLGVAFGLAAVLGGCSALVPAGDTPDDSTVSVWIEALVVEGPDGTPWVDVGYPQLHEAPGDPRAAVLRAINATIRDSVAAVTEALYPSARSPAGVQPVIEIQGGLAALFVTDDVLSTRVGIDAYTGGAHGTSTVVTLTFDLHTGLALAPHDLFRPSTPWGDTLATHVERAVRDALPHRLGLPHDVASGAFVAEGLGAIREGYLDLTLGADSLDIHVGPYELAPYAAGTFDVRVPYESIAPFVRVGSVLALLAER